jgi:predicted ATPase
MFHFRDVGDNAPLKQPHPIHWSRQLHSDGGNLAAYLYNLRARYNSDYQRIIKRIQIVAPFFQEFYLEPEESDPETIRLRWLERGYDVPLCVNLLSDGVLRFACILTVFRYPKEKRPDILLIDEPDLGMHPQAIDLLYHIVCVVSKYRQVIISTHTTELLDKFNAEDILVADRRGGKTVLNRLDTDELEEWLANRSLSEIWANSIIGGLPSL